MLLNLICHLGSQSRADRLYRKLQPQHCDDNPQERGQATCPRGAAGAQFQTTGVCSRWDRLTTDPPSKTLNFQTHSGLVHRTQRCLFCAAPVGCRPAGWSTQPRGPAAIRPHPGTPHPSAARAQRRSRSPPAGVGAHAVDGGVPPTVGLRRGRSDAVPAYIAWAVARQLYCAAPKPVWLERRHCRSGAGDRRAPPHWWLQASQPGPGHVDFGCHKLALRGPFFGFVGRSPIAVAVRTTRSRSWSPTLEDGVPCRASWWTRGWRGRARCAAARAAAARAARGLDPAGWSNPALQRVTQRPAPRARRPTRCSKPP